jgi:large subunit ribosomal protein L30
MARFMARTAKGGAAKATSKTAKVKSPAGSTIRIQYYRSFIAAPKIHKQMVRSLGLTKLNQIVERPDSPSMRGAVAKVPYLLRIVE